MRDSEWCALIKSPLVFRSFDLAQSIRRLPRIWRVSSELSIKSDFTNFEFDGPFSESQSAGGGSSKSNLAVRGVANHATNLTHQGLMK